MNHRAGPVLAAFALLSTFGLVSEPRLQGQQPPPAVPVTLLDRAASGGDVHVIVLLRTPFVPEGRLTAARMLDQRARIEVLRTDVINRLADLPARIGYRYASVPAFSAVVTRAGLQRLAAMTEVASVREDKWRKPSLVESVGQIQGTTARTAGYTGAGWTVAVLDTGTQKSHPFLTGATVSEACYSNAGGTGGGISLCPGGVSSSTEAGAAANCTGFEGCEHGTHVAGIAAGRNYTGGPGMNGVASAASLINVQVFTGFPAGDPFCDFGPACVVSFDSDQLAGLERVHALRNTFQIAAANLSLGGGRYTSQSECDDDSPAIKTAIDNLRSARIATVSASGNDEFTGALASPACISSAISVGSVGDGSFDDPIATFDGLSYFSNSAPFLSLLAPGIWINSSVPDGAFENHGGTSMAAPHVAGAWALLRQRKPLATVEEILHALASTGLPVADTRPMSPEDRTGGQVKPRIRIVDAINSIRVDYMAVDRPAGGGRNVQPFVMSGWALNMSAPLGAGTGVDTVHVWAFPASGSPIPIGVASYGAARGDVANAYGAQFLNSGWTIAVRGLAPGTYRLVAYARNTFNGSFTQNMSVASVTAQANPVLRIDAPANGDGVAKPFILRGWAADFAGSTTTGVDAVAVYSYPRPGSGAAPVLVGSATYGLPRGDVGAAYGANFTNSGWEVSVNTLAPGPHLLVAYAHSSMSNSFSAADTSKVTVGEIAATVDRPTAGQSGRTFTASGWALDLGAGSGTGIDAVHVYAYRDPGSGTEPAFLGLATYGGSRPDVGSAFGSQFTNSGFTIDVSRLAPGNYRLAFFPHSQVTGAFLLKTVDVIVTP